jgi:hypothetical protein
MITYPQKTGMGSDGDIIGLKNKTCPAKKIPTIFIRDGEIMIKRTGIVP